MYTIFVVDNVVWILYSYSLWVHLPKHNQTILLIHIHKDIIYYSCFRY